MSDSMPHPWEPRLQQLASAMVYPRTPDLWPAVRRELRTGGAARQMRPRLHWATALGAVALAVGLALFSFPPARAALYRVIQLGVVRILIEPGTATPAATVAPDVTPSPTSRPILQPPFDLTGLTTMEAVEQALGNAVRLPTYPHRWGDPDLAFLQSFQGPLAVLVWLDPQDPARAQLALHILGPGTNAEKTGARLIDEVEVNGQPALWLIGPHVLRLRSGEMDFRTLVTGNVLLWHVGEVTYRLEADRPVEEAVLIAESLE